MAEDAFTVVPRVYDVLLEDGPTAAVGWARDRGRDLLIDGRLDGCFVVVGRNVTVGRAGRVRADIHGESIIVEGEVEGDLHGSDQILVRSSGIVTGELVAPRVTLERGSKFQGAVEMRVPQAPRPKAGL